MSSSLKQSLYLEEIGLWKLKTEGSIIYNDLISLQVKEKAYKEETP